MSQSQYYSTIKKYYDSGHPSYTDESLKSFVKANMLTPEEYEQITGIPYSA